MDIIHSGEAFKLDADVKLGMKQLQTCVRCGYISSNDLCKACALLEGLEEGLDRIALKTKQEGGAEVKRGHRTIPFFDRNVAEGMKGAVKTPAPAIDITIG